MVNGSKVEISPQNALLITGTNAYITNYALYLNINDGGNYNAPDTERVFIRNSSYDSMINN